VNCLLDTHAVLWSLFSPERLSRRAADIIRRPENAISVSAISFWEISLKYSLGKLELVGVGPEDLPDAALSMGFEILPLGPDEAASYHHLPGRRHRDPFDRLLIWQAIRRGLVLISRDGGFGAYREVGLKTVW
jgi:PIN domain nuclease of toxin-antitoxin system